MSLFVFIFSNYIEVNSAPDWSEESCYNSYTGEKIVIPSQIFKVE